MDADRGDRSQGKKMRAAALAAPDRFGRLTDDDFGQTGSA
jgi:hypothetical protein